MRVRLRRGIRHPDQPLVLPVAEAAPVPPPWGAAAMAAGFQGQRGRVLDLPGVPRVLLAGTGKGRDAADMEAAGSAAARALRNAPRITLDARGLLPQQAAALALGVGLGAWQRGKPAALAKVDLVVDLPGAVAPLWRRAEAVLQGVLLARTLTALPANQLTPAAFAAQLEALAEHGIGVDILGGKRLRRLGAGLLLAVGAASEHKPRLAVLRWRGSVAAPPIAFIGKGICFDTGGISIKPAAGMEHMRGDMAGAAACAGAMLALALRQSPAPAVAVLPLAENAVGDRAYRPGDILHSLAGRSVEVVDTDAEGRLVLADALAYANQRFAPRGMLTIATLTGAVVTALGRHRAGLFGNDAALAAQLAAAGEAVGEKLWPLPIGEAHRRDLDSGIADLRQCAAGSLLPDASHAAAFLREFADGRPWAHLDIAGTARAEDGTPTGFGVRLLDALVSRHCEDAEA